MAQINRKFYNGNLNHNGSPIEDEILGIVKNTDNLETIVREDLRWPIFYNLSFLRENLFNWYPFKEDANLLEIGAECGALTGLFCQKVSKVTAVEYSEKKSQIIYNRHKNYSNLEIFPGNLNDMEFEEKFDYIVLCDVLEYASQFTKTDNPYSDFLKKIKTMLSEDGVILLAIENRLGLKYFSGSNEDHLGQSFLGIDDYPNINHVRTFSRFELEELIQDAAFSKYKFFYPYPDHKFPEIIHTDEFVEVLPFFRNAYTLNQEKIKFFNDGPLNLALAKENISKYFANSFLVELRNSDIFHESENIKYCKLTANRDVKFRTGTKIFNNNGNLLVAKFPLNQKSQKHIEGIYHNSKMTFGKIKCLESVFEDNVLVYPYIKELNLSYKFNSLLINDSGKKVVIGELKRIYDSLKFNSTASDSYHNAEFIKFFGEKQINEKLYCNNESNIDMNLSNLFFIDDEIIVIDYEWCFDLQVPIEFIFWKIIHDEIIANPIFRKFFTEEEIFENLGLNNDWISIFKEWDAHFIKYYNITPFPKQSVVSGRKLIMDSSKNKKLVQEKDKEIESLQKKIKKLKSDNSKLESKVKLMEKSTSWKVTSPLRKIMGKIKKFFYKIFIN